MKNPIQKSSGTISIALSFLFSALAHNGNATNMWWDNNGAAAATSGTWDNTSARWSTTSALTASPVANPNGNFPEFAAGTTAISALTITVNSAVTCAGMATGLSGATVTTTTFSGTGSIGIAGTGFQGFFCGGSTADGLVFNVPLSGTAGLEQESSGYIALNTNNSYSGGTDLTGGQVIYYLNNSSFGTGAITVNGSGNALVNNSSPAVSYTIANNFTFPTAGYNLNLAGGNPVAGAPGTKFTGTFSLPSGTTTLNTSSTATEVTEISGVISGSGAALTVADDGTLELGGVNTYTGATTISSPATLSIVGSGSLGSGSYAGAIANAGAFIYNSSASQTLSGVVSGAGPLIDTGSGTLTLSAVNTYTGNTGVGSGATLKIGSSGSLGSTYAHNITNNGTFNWNSSVSPTLSGALSGSGTFTQSGSGTITLSGSGNTFTGLFNVSSGLVAISSDANLGTAPGSVTTNDITLTSGTNSNSGLRVTASFTLNANRGITLGSSGGAIQASTGSTLTYNGVIAGSGALEEGTSTTVGEGTLVLGGANTYTGPTLVACGTMRLGATGALPSGTPLTVAAAGVGGTFDLNHFNQTIGPLASSTGIGGTGAVTPGILLTGALTVNETNNSAFSGVISGAGGSLTLTGTNTLTLNDTNSYTGSTTISSGTLALGSTSSINDSSSISIAAGATFDVSAITSYSLSTTNTLNANGATASPSTINGAAGGTVNLGSQAITLNYDGSDSALTISQGTLELNGNAFTINGSQLPIGDYTVATQSTGNISSSGTFSVTGSATGSPGTLSAIVVSNNNVNLIVYSPPVAGTASYQRTPNATLIIPISNLLTNVTATNAGTISLFSVTSPSTNGATISSDANNVYYVPPATGGNVTDSFLYTVSDSFGDTNQGTVVVTVVANNGQSVNITGMTTLGDGTALLSFAGIPGYNYLIEATTNLTEPITWVTLSTNQARTNGLFQYNDLDSTNYPTRYYRTATP